MSRITQAEFGQLLAGFERTAFRLECQPAYALGYEQADFDRFVAGERIPPPDLDWWRPWLEQVARQVREGKTMARVRVLAEPPTPYQQWQRWAGHWNVQAGEDIRYMARSTATRIGLPLDYDWWLLDDERLIVMRYTSTGAIDHKKVSTDPGMIARHQGWRDLAVHNATSAEEIAAA